MLKNDLFLLQWASRRGDSLNKVTIGQLVTLLELCGSQSVAAMSRAKASQAVNLRQKLLRLEKALRVGPLTQLSKRSTQANQVGIRIAGEVRLLLQEIQAAEGKPTQQTAPWILGAGDAWLQSAIVPALADLSREHPEWRWEVRNLKAYDICRGLKAGELHFGFVRTKDVEKHPGIELSTPLDVSAYAILAGRANEAPTTAVDLLRWLVKERRPLIQQGSTWPYTLEAVEMALKRPKILTSLSPQVLCETHPQAAAAAHQSSAWCIVPAALSRMYTSKDTRICRIGVKTETTDMALANYPRVLEKFPDGQDARDALRTALGRTIYRQGK